MLIEGPAGIGKSVVLDESRRRAAGDLRSLGARGGTLERDFGFGVVRQLLEVPARSREIPDAARAVLTDLGASEAGLSGEGSFAVLHGLFLVVLDLADERPTLLAVDDLQWADRPSLRFLAYLARRIEELPVVLLATIRTGEPDVDEALLDSVRQAPAVTLAPDPLSPDAVGGIDNGGGEELTFLARRRDERSEHLEARNVVAPGSGPPMHVHHLQEESLTVVQGTMGYRSAGQPEQPPVPVRRSCSPRGTCTASGTPAGRTSSARAPSVRPTTSSTSWARSTPRASERRQAPGFFDAAYLSQRYRSEFAILEVPAPVRRFVFPVIVAVGTLLGRYRRFAGAPEPVRRA